MEEVGGELAFKLLYFLQNWKQRILITSRDMQGQSLKKYKGSKRKTHTLIYMNHVKQTLLKLPKKTSRFRISMFKSTAPRDNESQLLKNLLLG